jgi:hypothetical protein
MPDNQRNSSTIILTGNRKTHAEHRRRLRKTLRRQGYSEREIARIVNLRSHEQQQARSQKLPQKREEP